MAHPMPQPHVGKSWWDTLDGTVGTGNARYDYLFFRDVRLQLEIASRAVCPSCQDDSLGEPPPREYGMRCKACETRLDSIHARDVIKDVRCWIDNDDFRENGGVEALSARVADSLKGKTLAEAVAVTFDDADGQPTLIEDAVRDAVRDWATKSLERERRLPQFPEEPPPYREPRGRTLVRTFLFPVVGFLGKRKLYERLPKPVKQFIFDLVVATGP